MKKLLDIDDGLRKQIQDYANENCDGNFTKAVDILLRGSLLVEQMAKVANKK